jgi:hypothetical protein
MQEIIDTCSRSIADLSLACARSLGKKLIQHVINGCPQHCCARAVEEIVRRGEGQSGEVLLLRLTP